MKKILLPTDFSEIAHNATQYALSIAKTIKAEIVFFHADQHNSEDLHKLKEEVSKALIGTQSVKASYISSHKQFNSLMVNEIVKANDIDLVVIGTTGEAAPLEKKIFGRNTTDITEHSNCPVISIPFNYKNFEIKNIAYASDLNFIDTEINQIIDLAKLFNATVEIFHVSPTFPDLGNVEKMNVQQKIEQIKTKYAKINYSVETTKHDNETYKGITSFINHHNTDLLVMFHNHVSAFDEFFATSNTEKAISHLKAPVLIYPKTLKK
ncbi:MAG TPA: universal stress protein [Bacteroidia bacterium]|nr:universal stress protein [Bacteroidia bacterium]